MEKPIEVTLLNNTKFIAHRGLSGIAPENTKEAFTLAGEVGYYGVECDIHVTRDHQFVVFHDFTLERMTNGSGFIHDLTVDEIKKLTITNGNGIHLYQDVKIPLLTEYLDICLTYQMVPIIEIKEVNDIRDIDCLIDLLREKQLFDKAIIISFHLDYLIYLRTKNSQLSIQYLVKEITKEVIDSCSHYRMNVDGNVRKITKKVIKLCHENNILVNCYTLDAPHLAQKLSENDIDFITTNILYQKR